MFAKIKSHKLTKSYAFELKHLSKLQSSLLKLSNWLVSNANDGHYFYSCDSTTTTTQIRPTLIPSSSTIGSCLLIVCARIVWKVRNELISNASSKQHKKTKLKQQQHEFGCVWKSVSFCLLSLLSLLLASSFLPSKTN